LPRCCCLNRLLGCWSKRTKLTYSHTPPFLFPTLLLPLVLTSTPLLFAALATLLLPESPRWLLEQGRTEEAWEVLVKAARWNGRKDLRTDLFDLRWTTLVTVVAAPAPAPAAAARGEEGIERTARESVPSVAPAVPAAATCPLQPYHHHPSSSFPSSSSSSPPSSFLSTLPLLLSPGLRATTLWLWVIWFSFGLGYYGLIVLCGDMFSTDGEGRQNLFDYPALLYAAASEVRVLYSFSLFLSVSGCGSLGFLFFLRPGLLRAHCAVWRYIFH